MAEGARELVRFEKEGDIGVITVDNPPVNAMSPGVPEGIVAALDKGNADPAVKAMVLIGAGRSFIAGADIRQFGRGPSTPPTGRRHYNVWTRAISRLSPRSTAMRWAAGSKPRSPAITGSRCRAPGSDCPRCRSAFCRAPAARSACRG